MRKDSGLIPGTATSLHCDPETSYLTSLSLFPPAWAGTTRYPPPRKMSRVKKSGVCKALLCAQEVAPSPLPASSSFALPAQMTSLVSFPASAPSLKPLSSSLVTFESEDWKVPERAPVSPFIPCWNPPTRSPPG